MGSRLDENSSIVRKRIESHTFDHEEGEEYEGSTFGGFGDYMRRKKLKLQNLDAEIRSSAGDCPPIFRGVVAHVNGYTQPSLQDLHRLIVSHGGGFLQYLDGKTAATHIIASSLTPKKREEFRRYRIVKPAWVVESIKARRMLPWDSFRVVDEGQSQKILGFDNGRILSQSNSPQSGYRDQSTSSWYASRLKESMVAMETGLDESLPRLVDTITTTEPASDDRLISESQSDYGEFPSFTSFEDTIKRPTTPKTRPVDDTEGLVTNIPPSDKMVPGPDSTDDQPSNPPCDVPPGPPSAVPDTIAVRPDMTPEEYNAQLLSDPRMRNSSVANPEFIQQFYRESRLHHLSTWKAELKAQLQARAREKSQTQDSHRKLAPGARRYILHVDFDCFFAAVTSLKHPELDGKPVAIAHGTGSGSEIASCNYPARARGVKNGMWMKGALQECPELKVLPYDFAAYEDASQKFYSSILSIDGVVQSVSIDEALVDITTQCHGAGGTDGRGVSEGSIYREQARADEIAQNLRDSVKAKTGCAVSVGIGGNILQAKVALRKAKPAGQFQLKPDAVLDFIGNLSVQNLPGVGYSLGTKMEELGVKLVKDIRELSRERLTSTLGPKTGAKLWDYARGIDRTEVGNEVMRKSVSAEVNWGIRFVNQEQADDFVKSLCAELHRRLVENLVKGKQLTLKVMRRSADAPLEPVKHLGHGKCDTFNKSVILGVATNATDVLAKEAVSMLKGFAISPGDLRGLGVQMTKLEPLKSGSSGSGSSSQQQLKFKASPVRKSVEKHQDPDDLESPHKGETDSVRHGPTLNDTTQKPLNLAGTQFIMPTQTDPKVVAELPNDIRSRLISQGKSRQDSRSISPCPPARSAQRPAATELPPQSQLDPDALAALPEDVRAEVLGYYHQPSRTTNPPQAAATAPTVRPSSSGGLMFKKPTTPTKKRRGRPSTKAVGNMTLTQSNFMFMKTTTSSTVNEEPRSRPATPGVEETGISEEFLAELPEDIRREVLEEQRRTRMLQQRSTNAPASAKPQPPAPAPPQPPKRLQLPPLPEKPTFTSRKLSNLPDLRDAVGSWHAAFADEGPFTDDVDSLSHYLTRVVLEEKDIDKAVSVVSWLTWLVEDGKEASGSSEGAPTCRVEGAITWDEALQKMCASVNEGLDKRGLPHADFT
ncbi:hypothetical protein BJX96DRAFT_144702 [Aspergillus floccosus]